MEQWGSDFSFDIGLSEETVITKIADAFTQPSDGGSYEAHVIGVRNGTQVVHSIDQSSSYVSTYSDNDDYEADREVGDRIMKLVQSRVAQIEEDRRKHREKELADERAREDKERERRERRQLEELKQKYEGTK